MSRKEIIDRFSRELESTYRQRTGKSEEIIRDASRYVPDGDMRISVWMEPYPTVMKRGDGCRLYDVDGNEYLDYSNNWTSMVLGNNHPRVVEAITRQAAQGSAMAAPFEQVYDWAGMICERISAMERVRFCTSGTEACMFAIRGARAFTGKDKILKMEGNYHGSYDIMEMQVGWRKLPPGLPKSAEQDVLTTPFNDKESAEKLIRENRDELAAVIVEGVMGAAGMIPPEADYLKFLKKTASENGVLLIVDEVISFRLSTGGAQMIYDVDPDLTALGKTIGGGIPVAAGIVSLQEMNQESLERINSMGESMADEFRKMLQNLGIKAQVKGYGSLQQIHFTPEPVSTASTAFLTQDRDILRLFNMAMMNQGLFIGNRGFFALSTVMQDSDCQRALEATECALGELKLV